MSIWSLRSFFLGTKIKHDDQKIYSRKFIFQRRDAKTLSFYLNTESTKKTKFAPCGA